MNRTHRRAGFAMIVAAALALAGCVTVRHTILMDRSAQPVPPDEVQILLEDDPVPESCARVAILDAQGSQDYTNATQMLAAFREEAGKLGANAVHLRGVTDANTGERIAAAFTHADPQRRGEAVALWCPEG